MFRACHRQWCLDWWHLSSQGTITCDTAWGQLNYPDKWKCEWIPCFPLLCVCVTFALSIYYHCWNTRRLLQHFKELKISSKVQLKGRANVGTLICVNSLFRNRTSPQAPTSPVQAGQEDSDLSVAHFLVPNSKWGWKKLHYFWIGVSLRPVIIILPVLNLSALPVSHPSAINGPVWTWKSACSYSHPGELRGLTTSAMTAAHEGSSTSRSSTG